MTRPEGVTVPEDVCTISEFCLLKERELDDLKRRFGAVEREKELLQNSSSAGHSEVCTG